MNDEYRVYASDETPQPSIPGLIGWALLISALTFAYVKEHNDFVLSFLVMLGILSFIDMLLGSPLRALCTHILAK